MKSLLLPLVLNLFKRILFCSLNQNNCPVYDAEEIHRQGQKEAIEKLCP